MRLLITEQKSRYELSSHKIHEIKSNAQQNVFIAQAYSSETHGKPGLATFVREGIGALNRRPERRASAVVPVSHMVIGTAFLEPLNII